MQPDNANFQLAASYFDGKSGRAQPVVLQMKGRDLLVTGDGIHRSVASQEVQWPERTRHGLRVAHFTTGGSVQCADAEAWDAWAQRSGIRESLVVKAQQSWRWVLASVLVLAGLLVALQQWGLPVAARAIVAVTPLSVDTSLGDASLAVIDGRLMRPSRLPLAEQQRLGAVFADAVSALPTDTVPPWRLVFRQSRIGPNAFALPGGTMVMTDEMVELAGHDDHLLIAVLAHELGHLRQRHGLRLLVQTTALGGLASLVVGDFSTVLAGAPVLLGQASYSREAEREADVEAVRLLRAARISPGALVSLFDKLDAARADKAARPPGEKGQGKQNRAEPVRAKEQDSWLGIAIASHPPDADRVLFFRQAAQEMQTGNAVP